jgi:Phosphoribosyl transferase domain
MLVIPVPLHPSKYAERGFNQSRSLAARALEFLRKSHPQWRLTLASSTLLRQRATDSQSGLTPRQRRLNVRGAFQVSDAARVKELHVLIVDDILTTGATARAAARALVDAGAASVWVATLARAQRRVAGFGGFGSTSVYDNMEEEEPLAGASAADLGNKDFDTENFSVISFSATSFSTTSLTTNRSALHGQPSF